MVAPFEGILKTVLDSGFRPWISDSSHSLPDSVRGIPGFPGLNFGFQSPGFPHPQAKIFWIPQAKMQTGFEKISRSTFC